MYLITWFFDLILLFNWVNLNASYYWETELLAIRSHSFCIGTLPPGELVQGAEPVWGKTITKSEWIISAPFTFLCFTAAVTGKRRSSINTHVEIGVGKKVRNFVFLTLTRTWGILWGNAKLQVGKGTVVEYWAVSMSCLSLFHCSRWQKWNKQKKTVSKCHLTGFHRLPGYLGKQEFIFTGLFHGGKSNMAFFLPSTDQILL